MYIGNIKNFKVAGIAINYEQNTLDLDTKVIEDYKKRIDKIKELIVENPELKTKEKKFVKRLDEKYEQVFKA